MDQQDLNKDFIQELCYSLGFTNYDHIFVFMLTHVKERSFSPYKEKKNKKITKKKMGKSQSFEGSSIVKLFQKAKQELKQNMKVIQDLKRRWRLIQWIRQTRMVWRCPRDHDQKMIDKRSDLKTMIILKLKSIDEISTRFQKSWETRP